MCKRGGGREREKRRDLLCLCSLWGSPSSEAPSLWTAPGDHDGCVTVCTRTRVSLKSKPPVPPPSRQMENKDILLLMVSQELFCKVSQLEIWRIFSKLKRKERGVYKVYPIMWACELMRPPVCVTEGIINLKHVTLIVMRFACGGSQQSSFQKSFNGVQRWSDHVSTTALTLRCVCVTQVQRHSSAQKSTDCGPCWGSWEGHWRRARWKRHLTRGELLPKFVRVEKYFTSVFQIFFLFFC